MVPPPWAESREYWRLLTAIFLHGGLVHLAFNTYVLSQLGRLAEHYFDARRTFTLFIVSGVKVRRASK